MKAVRWLCLILIYGCGSGLYAFELPFLKGIVGDRELPRPVGLNVDYYKMTQGYAIDDLSFDLGVPIEFPDVSLIGVKNEIDYVDIKGDVWLLPFLNVFGVLGDLHGKTDVNLGGLGIPLLGEVSISYDGLVYGGGMVLAGGGDRWFATVAATFTKSELKGDFDSSVESVAIQPRIGFSGGRVQYWVGGFSLSADESHAGNIDLPVLGAVEFAVDLSEEEKWNTTVGFRARLGDRIDVIMEGAFGDRDHILASLGYRF